MHEAFFDAANTFITVGYKVIDNILGDQRKTFMDVVSLLNEARERKVCVHTIGMGRSGLVGKFFAELLKLRGIRASTIGDILARPVSKGDIVFAFSGSGWTRTTTLYSELSLQRGATLVAITAGIKSKLDRLADFSIYVPGKPVLDETDYIARKIIGKYKTPLAPMGSIPEFSSLLLATGLALSIGVQSILDRFRDVIKEILDYARRSISNIRSMQLESLSRVIGVYKKAKEKNNCLYFIGMGLLEYISYMTAMRFQHLGANVCGISDWIIRRKGDILTILSASGKASIPLILAKEAKKSELVILSITSNKESEIYNLADVSLLLEKLSAQIGYFELGASMNSEYIPVFEITSFIIFESIVAELANILNITEDRMKALHANIE